MATIRRLYAYAASLAALEVWLWSLVSLLTKALKGNAWQRPENLAGALAGFLIGLPVFALHWRWVQREAASEPEERASAVRAWALYLALALTWGMVFHAAAALLGRALETALPLPVGARLFPDIGWARATALLLVYAPVGWYFSRVLAADSAAPAEARATARRWYRLVWLSYGLVWLALGLQQTLTVFAPPPGIFSRALLTKFAAQGVVLLAGGLTVWAWWGRQWWRAAWRDEAGRRSTVPVGFLMLWALVGLSVSLVVLGAAIARLLLLAFGDVASAYVSTRLVLTVGVPWLAVWLGAQWGLARFLRAWEAPRRAGAYRTLLSIIAFGGLATVSGGVLALLNHLTAAWFGNLSGHGALAAGITLLLLGLPLWALPWRALQAEAQADAAARHTPLRRGYLYLVLFVALLGLMGFATALTFQVLRAVLGGRFSTRQFVFAAGMAAWAGGVLLYHALVLRADRRATGDRTAERLAAFRVLLLAAPDASWPQALRAAASLPALALASLADAPPESADFAAVVLHEDDLLRLPAAWQTWLAAFPGTRVVVPAAERSPWVWTPPEGSPARGAAKALRALALGKQPPQCQTSTLWRILGYVGIFALVSWALGMIVPFLIMLAAQGMR